jgi:hypothetical protein
MTMLVELRLPAATRVTVTEDGLVVELAGGRTVSVPPSWYPRLAHASREQQTRWLKARRGA